VLYRALNAGEVMPANKEGDRMQTKQLLVAVRDGKVTLAFELGQLTINVPDLSITLPRVGSEIHNHIGVSNRPHARFLRPTIFGVASALTAIGLWKLHM
jgi:hypothetical protein